MEKIVATEPVPNGERLILSAAFDKDGEDPPGISTGMLSLFHGDVKVGEGRIRTQPGKFAIGGEGLRASSYLAAVQELLRDR